MRLTALTAALLTACTVQPSRGLGPAADGPAGGEGAEQGGDPDADLDPDADPAPDPDPDPGPQPDVGEGEGEGEGEATPPPAVAGAALELGPATLELGDVRRGERSELAELTVENSGDAASEPLSVGLAGAAGFEILPAPSGGDCEPESPLDPGATCVIGVAFSPVAGGPAVAVLSVGGQAAVLSANGLGFGPPSLSAGDVAEHDFGLVEEGAEHRFTFTNVGELPSGALGVAVSGPGFSASADDCSGVELDPAGQCSVAVRFEPPGPGPHEGVLHVFGAGAVRIRVTGEGAEAPGEPGPPELEVDPGELDLGEQEVGSTITTTITVSNVGLSGAPGLSWEGFGARDFSVEPPAEDGCEAGGLLPVDGQCALEVTFEPRGAGPRAGGLHIWADGLRGVIVPLSGEGSDEEAPGGALLSVASPEGGAALDLGFVEAPATASVVVRNAGDGPTGSLRTLLEGDPSYAILAGDDGCVGRPLGAGERCSVDVTFSPQANGGAEAALTVTSPGRDGEDQSVRVEVLGAGRGFDPAVLVIAPDAHDYGPIDVGEQSGDEFFTVRNDGDLPARALRISLGGQHPGDYVLADVPNGCEEGVDLPGGAACLIGARFAPQAGNARSAQLAVAADGVELPAIAELSGRGHSDLNGDLGGIPFCFERNNSAGHRVGVFNSRNGQNPSQRHNGHADWRSFCQANGWDDHNRGAGNSNNTCDVLADGYVRQNHLDAGGNWDHDDYPPNRPEGRGHVFHTCIIYVD